MGSVRPETYYAGERLLQQLDRAKTIHTMLHDGGDIILFQTPGGQRVSIHMIQSSIPLYEIRKIVSANDDDDIYTLFMLWAAMMVPNHDQLYRMTDWMQAFVDLHGGLVYAYDIYEATPFLFPAFFQDQGTPGYLRVEYGTTLRTGEIAFKTVEVNLDGQTRPWRVAYFGTPQARTEDVLSGRAVLSGLEADYALLGVTADDDRETVKQAYRMLARRYHPDANPSKDAHQQMQRLNAAYEAILDALE